MTNEINTLIQPSAAVTLPNAVIYARVSTQQQAKKGYSLQSQVDACTQYAQSNGYTITKIFTDIGSARTLDRPNFKEMIKFCSNKENNVKTIITSKFNRLCRGEEGYIELSAFVQKNDIKLLTAYENNSDESNTKITIIKKYLNSWIDAKS